MLRQKHFFHSLAVNALEAFKAHSEVIVVSRRSLALDDVCDRVCARDYLDVLEHVFGSSLFDLSQLAVQAGRKS